MATHQKRISVPKSWQISKKSNKWITSTRPGPHNRLQSIPLAVILRDMLGVVDNRAEAKRVLSEGNILVDGVARKDLRFPVGLMDIVTIPLNNVEYRVMLDGKNRLVLNKLDGTGADKLCRIEDKTSIKDGKVQMRLNDGVNIIGSNDYNTKDSIILSVPDKKIVKHIKYEVGNLAMIVGGTHAGEVGSIKEISTVKSSKNNTVTISGESEFETIEDYVFVIGESKPEISMGGETVE